MTTPVVGRIVYSTHGPDSSFYYLQPGGPLAFTSPRPVSPASELSDQPSKILAKSLFSFKVLTECPIIVVLLFQTHRQFVNPNIATFVPLIIQVCNGRILQPHLHIDKN